MFLIKRSRARYQQLRPMHWWMMETVIQTTRCCFNLWMGDYWCFSAVAHVSLSHHFSSLHKGPEDDILSNRKLFCHLAERTRTSLATRVRAIIKAVVWGTGPGRGKTPLVAWLEEEEQSVCSNIRRWANDGRGMKNITHNSHQRAEAGRNVTDVVITFDVPHYNLPRRSPLFKWDSHLSNVIMMTRAPPLDDVNLWPMVLCKNFFHVIVRIGH